MPELCDLPLFLCCVYPITHPSLCSAIALQPRWYCGSVRSDCDPPPLHCSLSHTQTASIPSAPQKSATSCQGATSVYVSHVKERQPRRGNARECMGGTPQSPTGKCNRELNHLGDKYVEGNHTHSADKHGDAHIRAPPYRRLAI